MYTRILPAILSAFVFLFASKAHAACMQAEPMPSSEIMELVAQAEQAFRDADEDGVRTLGARVEDSIECTEHVFTNQEAARIYRFLGMLYFMRDQPERAKLVFAASKNIDVDHSFEQMGIGSGHPLQTQFEEASEVDKGSLVTVRMSEGEHHFLDGTPGASWYENLPGLLHRFCVPEGHTDPMLCETEFIEPGEDLPAWAQVAPAVTVPTQPLVPPARNSFFTKPGVQWTAAGLLVAGAGVSCASAVGAHNNFLDPSTPMNDLSGLETRANVSTASCATLGALAVVPTTFALKFTFGRSSSDEPTELTMK